MNTSLRRGGFTMGLIGSIISLCTFLIIYIIHAAKLNTESIIYSSLVLVFGIIGAILGIIGISYSRNNNKKFPVVMTWVSGVMILGASISTVIYYAMNASRDVMSVLPFTFIPDFLIIISGLFLALSNKKED